MTRQSQRFFAPLTSLWRYQAYFLRESELPSRAEAIQVFITCAQWNR